MDELVNWIEQAGGPAAYERVMGECLQRWPELRAEVEQMVQAALERHWYSVVLLLGISVLLAGPVKCRMVVEGQEIALYDWDSFREAMRRVSLLAQMLRKGVVRQVCEVLRAWAGSWRERQEGVFFEWLERNGGAGV